jgi:hypothetical protein
LRRYAQAPPQNIEGGRGPAPVAERRAPGQPKSKPRQRQVSEVPAETSGDIGNIGGDISGYIGGNIGGDISGGLGGDIMTGLDAVIEGELEGGIDGDVDSGLDAATAGEPEGGMPAMHEAWEAGPHLFPFQLNLSTFGG